MTISAKRGAGLVTVNNLLSRFCNALEMSKDKRKNQFTLGDTPRKDVLNDLPDSRYADEEGVETTNILAPKGEAGPVEGYSSIEGTDEYLFKGIKPGGEDGILVHAYLIAGLHLGGGGGGLALVVVIANLCLC